MRYLGHNNSRSVRSTWFRLARSAALLAILVSVATEIDARGRGGGGGFRGGGIRGGGSTSFGRGGGDFGRGSYSRSSDSYRSGSTFSRDGDYSRPSALDSRPSRLDGGGSRTDWGSMTKLPPDGGSAAQLPATRPGGGGSATQLPTNRPGGIGGSGTQLPANRPGDGGRHWRPDCPKCNDGWDGWVDHPIAAGIAIGAIAGARAAIGTYWYSLPPDCPPYLWNDLYYYSCDGTFFAPIYEGDTIVYVSVPDPAGGQQPPAE